MSGKIMTTDGNTAAACMKFQSTISLALILLMTALVSACQDPEPLKEVLLLDCDFTKADRKMTFPAEPVNKPELFWFAEGWGRSDNGLFWIRETEAVLYLHLLGSEATLALDCGTPKNRAARGLELNLITNGCEAGRFVFEEDSPNRICVITIPDEGLKQGINTLRFQCALLEPDETGDDAKKKALPRLFLRSLKARARLDETQQADWRKRTAVPQADSGWEPVKWEGADERRDPSSPGSEAAAAALPDVLMILLDAARPDHFGCYGYGRDTTPCIDRLAQDGVVFKEAFAPAPYTLCSVGSILTGRSWLEHGVIKGKEALSDDFVTLAEVLKNAGYFTLAISSNACFSTAYNSQQGFNEFIESWKRRETRGLDPEFPERYLAGRLDEGLGAAPAFVYLHLMPPHQPYTPGKAHDLWSDPGYTGEVDGSNDTIHALDRGKLPWNEADRQRLIDLYDGNLNRIDASVGRILDRWHALDRHRELLVVVFSDHGEAFGEHTRFSHNSTVYDEMIRVPLLFHPAGLCPSLAGHEEAFLCLTDLMPLVLHAVGIPLPPHETWPRRFLEVLSDPGHSRSAILLRNHADLVGLRTPSHLALVNAWTVQELFDYNEDPFASKNLRLVKPDRFAGMIARIRALFTLQATGAGPGAVETKLSEEDIKNLEALGYMR